MACIWLAAGSRTGAAEVQTAKGDALTFEVDGSAMRDLYPGAVRRTRVTIANPHAYPIKVQQIDAHVASTSKWRCEPTTANLTVGNYLGSLPLIIRARDRTGAGEFEVRMPNTVANACQKAEFRLVFTAEASRVGR